jgi:DNA-binding CsgD family transcriptional regulator
MPDATPDKTISAAAACRLALVPTAAASSAAGAPIDLSCHAFSELLQLSYVGVSEPVPWQSFLARIGHLLKANWVSLALRAPTPDCHGLVLAWKEGHPVRMATNYNQYAYAIDPFVHLPVDQVLSIDEVIDDDALRRCEFYKQFLEPENIGQMLGVDFQAAPDFLPGSSIGCHFRLCRPGNTPRFSQSDRELLRMLLPHLKLAVQWHSQNDAIVSERELYAVTVDRMLMGVVILDETGTVLKATATANEVLTEADGISLANGSVRLYYEQENRRLQRLIADSLAIAKRRRPGIAEAMAVTRPSGRTRLGVVVRAIPHNAWAEGKRRPTVAVMIRDPERKSEGSHEILRKLYELTAAESVLALKLANGLTLDEASAALGTRKNTSRAHLRSIFSKTGVTRQTMLVRLILGDLSMS